MSEMFNTTISNKRYKSSEFQIKQPLQMVELKLHIIIDGNPHLINALDRSVNHSLFQKFSDVRMI